MELESLFASLSEIEITALGALKDGRERSAEEISGESGLNADSVRRALQWLAEKKLIELHEEKDILLSLSEAGKDAESRGLPEKRMLLALQKKGGKAGLGELDDFLAQDEKNIAMGIAKRNAWIAIHKGEKGPVLELTGLEKGFLGKENPLETLIGKISGKCLISELNAEEKKLLEQLAQRGLVERKDAVERKAAISSAGLEALKHAGAATERAYNIQGAVPKIFAGKKQPYIRFLGQIRRKLTELGFKEMETHLVELEFYNFDVLFQPQNHPARSWTDTYKLKQPKTGSLPSEKIVKLIKDAHEFGGKTGSTGWGYKWNPSIAMQLMPAAHGTAASARQLAKGVEEPGKYFTIARCFRPDIVDATHLNEFNQMEGFIVDENFNFRHLLGMLKQFAVEIAGAEEVKFLPDYYPFTEPSVQLSARHPKLGWFEFGGAGIFRPEMTEQLGIKGKCLAWGLGVDRLAMCALGINDIRYLFSTDLNWLRKEPLVEVE